MNNNEIRLRVNGGYLIASETQNPDEEYPGITVEFVSDSDCDQHASRPRITMEFPIGHTSPRALIWTDPTSEDTSKEIQF